jgi:hypothetical protein
MLSFNAVITQTCITLLDIYIEKNLEDFIFRQITECATLDTSEIEKKNTLSLNRFVTFILEDLKNEFIFLFGDGVSPEKKNDGNCIIA